MEEIMIPLNISQRTEKEDTFPKSFLLQGYQNKGNLQAKLSYTHGNKNLKSLTK